MKHVDLSTIDPQLRACLEAELAAVPGARLIRRRRQLFFQGTNGFEILCSQLCKLKRRWLELVEHADLATRWPQARPSARYPKALNTRMKTARKLDIVHAFVLVTEGRLTTDLDKLLQAMRKTIPDLTEADLRTAIKWAVHPRSLPFPRANALRQPSKRLQAVT